MVESYQSRVNAVVPAGGFAVAPTSAAEGTDPISGREWVTDSTAATHSGLFVDREYACIFKLAAPRNCDFAAMAADPTLVDSCDCSAPQSGTGSFTHDRSCGLQRRAPAAGHAKAYPTIRELLLAKPWGSARSQPGRRRRFARDPRSRAGGDLRLSPSDVCIVTASRSL
jgi:hypothetical protein